MGFQEEKMEQWTAMKNKAKQARTMWRDIVRLYRRRDARKPFPYQKALGDLPVGDDEPLLPWEM